MKGFSNREFEKLITELESLVGCRFQELGEQKSLFVLNFWSGEEGIRSWVLDLNPSQPLFLEMSEPQKARSPVKKTPITLFLKAHIEGRILNSVDWDPTNGRVFTLNFGEGFAMEFRLYTGGANWIAVTPDKKLSYRKPAELKKLEWKAADGSDRALSEIFNEFYKPQQKSGSEKVLDTERHRKKMERAIEKLESDIAEKKATDWNAVGQTHLEAGDMSGAAKAFQKSKDLKSKLERAEVRLLELRKELESGPSAPTGNKKPPKLKTGVRGRTKTLTTGHSLFVGKNAADNLKILRAASAWDYWLHLKDYPGAHGIIRRNKKEKLSQSVMREAAQALVLEHLKKKTIDLAGQKFDVLLTEVRYVRPIKGDKLGRVNYSNEMTLSVGFL